MKFNLLFSCIICFLFPLVAFSASSKYRLILRSDPATTITIGWDAESGSNHRVYYDIVDYGTDTTLYSMLKYPDAQNSTKGMDNTFARLIGLTPNTVYYFVVADDNYVSQRMSFKTCPDNPDEPLSFIVGGDSRNNRPERRNANKMVQKLRPHAVFFGGDYVADGTNNEWAYWFEDWQHTMAPDGRMTPIIATQGNHELVWTNFPYGNDVVDKLFDTPGNDHYYSITFGGNLIRSYILDSEYVLASTYGTQTNWLVADLQGANNIIWKAAQYHSPIRPHESGKPEGTKQYNEWAPLFDQYDFAFVSENDAHTNKMTWPIKKSTGTGNDEGFIRDDFDGTVYFGEGGWGAPLRNNDDPKSWTRASSKQYNIKWLHVRKDTIEIRTILTNNADSVGWLNDSNIFILPSNIDIWDMAGTGNVVYIQKFRIPYCEITDPLHGEYYQNPQAIDIEAFAIDTNGTISEVEFFIDGISIGIDYSSPYMVNWTIPNAGLFNIHCKATNNQGVSSLSQIISIGCGFMNNTISTTTCDDAEENINNGSVDLSSGDIELIKESGLLGLNEFNQEIGIRFCNLNIPQNASIDSAFIQFTCDETNNENPCILNFYAHSIDDAFAFSNNAYDISSRSKTTSTIQWLPADWNNINECSINQQTPNLSTIIQEIVDRPGWTSGNDIAVIINGQGRRNAKADNAILTIKYSINIIPEVSISIPQSDTLLANLNLISINAVASDFDGSITMVEFFADALSIGIDSTAPYSIIWNIPNYSEYEITAVATDNESATKTSNPIMIKATTPPFVQMTTPAVDTIIYGLTPIQLQAYATDSIGNVERVEFYVGGTKVGEDITAPYTYTWTPPFYASFYVEAAAIDNDSVLVYSSPISITYEFSNMLEGYCSDNNPIKIYPNPVDNAFTIEFSNDMKRGNPIIVIYDNLSKNLMQKKVKMSSYNKIFVDISDFNPGVYYLQIIYGDIIACEKIVKN